MNMTKMFKVQKEFDATVTENHPIQEGEDRLRKKVQALITEIGELSNELRESFKFWSNKKNDYDKARMELSDVTHFLFSIGNDLEIDPVEVAKKSARAYEDLTSQFLAFAHVVSMIGLHKEKQFYYMEAISLFKGLVALIGFTSEELEQVYYEKNKINQLRQDSGTY